MRANNIRHTRINVQKSRAGAIALRKINPRGGIPTFMIDGRVMIGFSARHLRRLIDSAAERRASRM